MIEKVTPDAVGAACKRLEDFIMVNASRPKGDLPEAVARFAEAAGLDSRAHASLHTKFEQIAEDDDAAVSWGVLGVIIGLFLADELDE